jgi:CheY-like chemotaxis protein
MRVGFLTGHGARWQAIVLVLVLVIVIDPVSFFEDKENRTTLHLFHPFSPHLAPTQSVRASFMLKPCNGIGSSPRLVAPTCSTRLRRPGLPGFMRKKILLVDDNSEWLELLRLNFKQAGFSIATARNGLEALKKARSVEPDAVVLDLVLPELDGFAVCETLRRSEATAKIPVIMLTGLTSEMTRCAGLESGATEFVTKPASLEHLLSRVKHWIRHARQQAEAKHARIAEPA